MICAHRSPAESWAMTDRPVKITFAQMRNSGVRGILVYRSDYKAATRLRSAATRGPMM
jgi:hypothetical protein